MSEYGTRMAQILWKYSRICVADEVSAVVDAVANGCNSGEGGWTKVGDMNCFTARFNVRSFIGRAAKYGCSDGFECDLGQKITRGDQVRLRT